MHFSKTYAHLLSTLPPELRDNPFEYRKVRCPRRCRMLTDLGASSNN